MQLPNELHQTLAAQIDNMKPDDLKPGVDIGMEPIAEDTLRVLVRKPELKLVDIRYDAGPDTYTVTEHVRRAGIWIARNLISDVYCDQLGEILFGATAKPFTLPIVQISTDDGESWETIA